MQTFDDISYKFEGEEDCLNLNVFVPAQNFADNETLAVMFVITGGRFFCNYAFAYGPDFFIDQNVIVVSNLEMRKKKCASEMRQSLF